ncbi:hypothetical protein [Pseudonocardia sp. NPDC046786]
MASEYDAEPGATGIAVLTGRTTDVGLPLARLVGQSVAGCDKTTLS